MALSKIQAESMNLADTYAFTGTVSGAGDPADYKKLITTTISSSVQSVDFGSTYINSTYKIYKIYFRGIKLDTTDNLAIRIGAGGTLLTSSNYQKGGMADGFETTAFAGISGTTDTMMPFGGHHENTSSNQEYSGEVTLYDLVNNTPNKAVIYMGCRVGTGQNRFDVKGYMNPNTQTCNIISLLTVGSANMTSGQVSLYGIKE
jgi:hypothetical protein